MSRYFKIIILISSYKKNLKGISLHNLALITWHLKTFSDVSNFFLTTGKESNSCLGDN